MKKIILGLTALLITASVTNAQLFTFFSTTTADNSTENTGVAVSGSVELDTSLGTIKITLNNLSGTDSYSNGDIVAFGFADSPDGTGASSYSFAAAGHTNNLAPRTWTDVDPFTQMWGSGEAYFGAEASNKGDNMDGIFDGELGAMFTFQLDPNTQDLNALADYWTNNNNNTYSSSNNTADLLVRFQSTGLDNEGSDKLAINLVQVPEPSTYGMIGASALMLLVAWRRFKKVID